MIHVAEEYLKRLDAEDFEKVVIREASIERRREADANYVWLGLEYRIRCDYQVWKAVKRDELHRLLVELNEE